MTPQGSELFDWMRIVAGALAVIAAAAMVLRLGLRGGGLERPLRVSLVCPNLRREVDCTIVHKVRIGQWRQVLSCSAFDPAESLTCDRECVRDMNRGFGQVHVVGTSGTRA